MADHLSRGVSPSYGCRRSCVLANRVRFSLTRSTTGRPATGRMRLFVEGKNNCSADLGRLRRWRRRLRIHELALMHLVRCRANVAKMADTAHQSSSDTDFKRCITADRQARTAPGWQPSPASADPSSLPPELDVCRGHRAAENWRWPLVVPADHGHKFASMRARRISTNPPSPTAYVR